MTRDFQRARVYDAERLTRAMFARADSSGVRAVEVLGSRITLPVERRFASVASVQSYADAVLALNWVRARFERAATPVRVRERQGSAAAHYERESNTIAVPVRGGGWALRELVLLHEIAHHLEPDPRTAPHGPQYCLRLLDLVDGIVGNEAAFLLRTCMFESGVRCGGESGVG